MKTRRILRAFFVYFVLTFIVGAVVSYLYSLIAHGQGTLDWGSSFRTALTLGLLFSVAGELQRKEKQ